MSSKPAVHPDMQVLIDARDPDPAPDLAGKRRQWAEYAAKLSQPHPPELDVNDEDIPVAHGEVGVRIYRHEGAERHQPCVIYLHGGAALVDC